MSMPAAESSPPGKPAVQDSPETVTVITPLSTKTLEEIKEDTRQNIAHRLIFAYIILLAFTILVPVVSLWIPHVGSNGFSVINARDLMLAMSGTLSGLVGIIGFVMGYYFKELDKPAATTASRRRTKSS
jgi:hypothetical protein